MNTAICWLDGKIQPVNQAKISILDHGFLYGDGVFEGIRFYNNKPFLLAEHLQRLDDSAKAIALEHPHTHSEIAEIINQLITQYPEQNGYIRLIITRGKGALGIDPRHCQHPQLVVILDHLQLVNQQVQTEGAKLIIASTRKLASDGLDPRIKSLNYLNAILAKIEANHANADEAIMLNQNGKVCEGSADNIFMVKNNQLVTPPVSDGALSGITRELIIQLAKQQGITIIQQSLSAYDLYTADECFLTGTGAEMIPVSTIDGRKIKTCPGRIYQQCQQAFADFIQKW